MTSRVKMSSQQFHTVTNNKIWLTKKSLTNLQIPEDHWQMTETVNCHFRCCLRKDWRSYFRFRCLRSCCHCLRSCCWCYWSCCCCCSKRQSPSSGWLYDGLSQPGSCVDRYLKNKLTWLIRWPKPAQRSVLRFFGHFWSGI